MERPWTPSKRQNCLTNRLVIISRPNGLSGFNETTTKLAYGIGVKYDFTEKISGRAQYEDFGTVGNDATTGTTKATLLSAGLVLKF